MMDLRSLETELEPHHEIDPAVRIGDDVIDHAFQIGADAVTLFVGYVEPGEQPSAADAAEPVPLRVAGPQAEQADLGPTAAAPL